MNQTSAVSLDQFTSSVALAFQRARKTTPLPFAGAIVPFKSPIDKAAAYAVMSMHCGEEPVWLHVCKTTNFSKEQIAEWDKKGICCIDLGQRKYHYANEGSATEWLVRHYSLPRTTGVQKLIEVINKNNQTGYLKSFRNAVPHIMRELYELEPNDADWWSVKVFSEAAKVVVAFVRVQNGESGREPSVAPADVTKLVNDFGDVDKPLTLGQYAWHLWILGEPLETIQEKLEFWQKGIKRLADARQRAKAEVAQAIEKGNLPTFRLKVGKDKFLPGVLLVNRDHFFTKGVLHARKFAVRVIVDENGHAAISTNNFDCSALAKALELREPGKWHHNEQMGSLINGGPMYVGNPVTQIPALALIQFAKEYLALKPRKK